MKYTDLKKALRSGDIGNLYLFYGEEDYLIRSCTDLIKKKVVDEMGEEFNFFSFTDQNGSAAAVAQALEGYPMLADKKMLVLKNVGLFTAMSDSEKDRWCEIFSDVPDYACVVLWEKDIDKRSKVYKRISAQGETVEFAFAGEADLKGWIARLLLSQEKKIENNALSRLLTLAGPSMTRLETELGKVIGYVGQRDIITLQDVNAVIAPPLSDKVFEMCDAILDGNGPKAIAILEDLKSLRESGVKILSILSSSFCDSFRACLLAKEGLPYGEMVKEMHMPGRDFVAKKYLNNAKRRDPSLLREAIALCREADSDIKLGRAGEWDALELVVLKALSGNAAL